MSTKKVNWAYKKHFGDVVDDDGATADGVEITEGKSARAISCIQNFDIFLTHTHTHTNTHSGHAHSCRIRSNGRIFSCR